MQRDNLIAEKLSGYEDFIRYCNESGKRFVDELDREDFIAYRAEYSASRERVEQIKNLLGFREQNHSNETSDNHGLAADSLGKFFYLDNVSIYENVLLEDLDFNTRVQRCLSFNGYKTLAALLKSSRNELAALKSFGNGSFKNLVSTLEKFFAKRRKKSPSNAVRRAKEELDEFLYNEALNHAPQIDLIISAFEMFAASVTVKNMFRDLPDEFNDKRVRPFLLVCGLNNVELPEDLTIAELPDYVAENSIEFDIAALKYFVDTLNFDVKACVNEIFASLFKNERESDVVYRRAKGDTLAEIGANFGITRERVRQIESKSVKRFKSHLVDVKKILCFLHAMSGKSVLTANDAGIFIGDDVAEMLWFFVSKIELPTDVFHFNAKRNAVVFGDETDFDEMTLIENLPDVMTEKFFDETISALAREKNCSVELIASKLTAIYNRSGKIFHRGKLTVTFKCKYLLKERFPNGYKIGDETYYLRFMRYIREIFDDKTPLTQRNVDAKIGILGVLCDRGKYIHPDFVHISPEIMVRVKDFIDDSDQTAIFYKEIFANLKNFFVGTQITNHYFLQGAIKFHKLPYTLRKDYLTKASEISMGKEFDNFVAERGEVSLQEIKDKFISFQDCNIAFLVNRCPEIIRIGDGALIHATKLNLHAEDFERIRNFLRKNCSPAIKSRVLFDLFFERFADFMTRNEIQNHNKLFGVLRYMFRDEFNFENRYISATDIEGINNRKFLLQILADTNEIDIEDIIGICEENEIHFIAKTYLIDSLRPDFIRVDEFTLMRPETIGITDEIISDVAENIRSAVAQNGGRLAAQAFEDYEWLPQLEIPWNSFLLESVVSLAEDAPYKIKFPATSANFSTTIFLSDEFDGDDYKSFIVKILSDEHAKEPFRSEREIFDWLKKQCLCAKNLSKFLRDGRAFELLSE